MKGGGTVSQGGAGITDSSGPVHILVRSLGCRVNLADAAEAVDRLGSNRYQVVEDVAEADVAVLHTCTVTHKADRDVRKILGSWRRKHPRLQVVVAGCAVATMREVLSRFENVCRMVPPGDPAQVAEAVAQLCGSAPALAQQPSAFHRLGRQRAVVKVQDGCNSRCGYCVIPGIRGPERSLPVSQVQERISQMARWGHREMVLSGIHLGRYGMGLAAPVSLAGLIRDLSPIFANLGPSYRLRLSSVEPMEWTDELLEVISNAPFVCRHFHVPLQSGDDSVLARMGRPCRAQDFAEVIRILGKLMPEAALGTDVLVGFPGEDEAASERTRQLIESLPLSYLHVFTFSPRPGTPAQTMPDQVPRRTVRNRAARVRRVGQEMWRRFMEKGIGRHHQVLIERRSPNSASGRTREYRRIRLLDPENCRDQVAECRAEALDGGVLLGVVSEPGSSPEGR